MSTYTAGQMVRFRWYFTNPDSADARVQPTSATVTITTPAGSSTTYQGSLDSTNTSYVLDYDTTGLTAGTYTAKFAGTGTYKGAQKTTFTIG